jgi:DUF438 domain-containing protein
LPLKINYVDKEDTVKYFNKPRERRFERLKAAIGRKVQKCHQQKTENIVNQILKAFKKGEKDKVEYWIKGEKEILYNVYLPVRDKTGKYLGTIEITQDISNIKKHFESKTILNRQ